MTYEELFQQFKPKEEFTVSVLKSKETGNYIASIYRKGVSVNRYKKETMEASLGCISTKDMSKYIEFLSPYIEPRN